MELAEHPFVIDFGVVNSNNLRVKITRRRRRAWELHVILALILSGRITRFGERQQHFWAMVGEPPDLRAKYLPAFYLVPEFVAEQDEFSDIENIPRMAIAPSDEYFSRFGIEGDEELDVPDIFETLLASYEAAPPDIRDRFLRACYWHDRSRAAWDASASLGFTAAANAIEVLLPATEEDRCPTCGLNRAPGVTRRFVAFLEQYAPAISEDERRALYELRSSLVHGHVLFDLDSPGPWGALVPRDIEQEDALRTMWRAARIGAMNWLLANGEGSG